MGGQTDEWTVETGRLHLVGKSLGTGNAVGLRRGRLTVGLAVGLRVVSVESADAVHLIVNAAGDVLDVLHVGSEAGGEMGTGGA